MSPGKPQHQEKRSDTRGMSMIRSAGVVGLFTLLSRVFGLLRDMVVAALFPKWMTDAFFVAFTIPNVLRRLLGEGSLTQAIIPVFTGYLKKGREEAKRFYGAAFFAIFLVGAALSLIGMVAARPITLLFAGGFDSTRFELAVSLTRILFPYLLLVSLMAFAMGILNTLGHFAMPAAGPVFLNITMIAGAFAAQVISRVTGWHPMTVFAVSVLVGGVFQYAVNVPPLVKLGFPPRFRKDLTHPGVREVMRLMGPAIFGLAVYQVNVILARLLASFLPEGSVSYIYYSQRLFEFPMGVFAVALSTAAMPRLSDHAADGDHEAYRRALTQAMELNLFVVIPAAVALSVFAIPTVTVFFERGRFDHSMTWQTSKALWGFAVGLVPAGLIRQMLPAFYALKETKIPVKSAVVSLISYAILGPVLMFPLKHAGLALAVSLGAWIQLAYLIYVMNTRFSIRIVWQWGLVGRMVAAAGVMGLSLVPVITVGHWSRGGLDPLNIVLFFGGAALGAGVYAGAAKLLNIPQLSLIVKGIIGRRRGL